MRRAVFLDRDGVLNRALIRGGKPYPPATPEELELLPGVPEALWRLRHAGFLLIVVTNQPDVARGVVSRDAVEHLNALLAQLLDLDEFRVCFHDDCADCPCRKPKPGLLISAAADHGIDLTQSWMIGDRWRDIDAGHAAGCRAILIDYQYDERAPARDPVARTRDLAEAAAFILSGE